MSEENVIAFRSQRNNINPETNNSQPGQQLENKNPPNIENPSPSPGSSVLKTFLTSKKGIVLLSFFGVVVVGSVVAAVVVTQTSKKDEEGHHHYIYNEDEIFEDEDNNEDLDLLEHTGSVVEHTGSVVEHTDSVEEIDKFTNDIRKEDLYTPNFISLTKNNLVQSKITGEATRTVPVVTPIKEGLIAPTYNSNNPQSTEQYDSILEENQKLVTSENTYDEITEDGKLYLKNEDTGNSLYKHSFSIGLYGGDISDNEKSVIKEININPTSSGNYITGLYAPAGEVIKIVFEGDDLNKIGGSLEFTIGQITQNGIGSINSNRISLKRVPILFNKLIIKKNPGYIGSFIGGPIYISNPPIRKPFKVTISNAVPYKHLIYGSTTKEEFESMNSYTAPFFELDVRDSIRYSGPLSIIKDLDYDNLIKNLIFWDKCVRTSRNVPSGWKNNLGIHFLFDPCVNSPGALALAYVGNNWCQVPTSFGMALDYETATKYGVWGHIHELNHHFQRFGFHTQVSNEVTNNVINLVEYVIYSQISGLRNEFSNAEITKISGNHLYLNPEHALRDMKSSPPNSNNELRFYEPILQAFGYDLFIKVTQYGKGQGGVDLFSKALTETLQYDFTYYIEKILNLQISESVLEEIKAHNYHIFIPVSSIYQTGRYFNYDGHQHFSNTSFPYRIPRGGPTKLDFVNHIIVPNGFTYEIVEITEPIYGELTKISDLIYTYTPDSVHDLSGTIKLTLLVENIDEGIRTHVKLGLKFQVDNSKSIETDYIYDEKKYTNIETAIESNFEGYSQINFFPNSAGSMSGISEGNIGVWEGKFKIKEEGYSYIVYKGGRGHSVLYAKINNEAEYRKIGEILINQSAYLFNAKAHYKVSLQKGDIVYFKLYLLGQTLSNGAKASVNIGISMVEDIYKVKTLGKEDIVGTNAEFDQPYEFYSGDPYKTDKQVDSLSFFDYGLVQVESTNFVPWDASFGLDKLIDHNENTYMHTGRNFRISASNPLILIFDLGKKYTFNSIIFNKGSTKDWYIPRTVKVYTSEDKAVWNEKGEGEAFTCEKVGDREAEINLNEKIETQYIKLEIMSQMSGYYIAIATIDFVEKGLLYYMKTPEEAEMQGKNIIDLNFNNFPYFGHSYILKPNCAISFLLEETTGIKIKVCNKYISQVDLIVDNDKVNKKSFNIIEEEDKDFPIEIRDLEKGKHRFKIEVKEGKIDFEYILYEVS